MSLSGALSNAMSGLTANARGTAVVSSNIANAMTEGYGRRDLALGTDANSSSGGVRVEQITRQSDPVLSHQARVAAAGLGAASTFADFSVQLEQLWGSVDTIGSVAEKLTQFETAMTTAASDPSSDIRLRNVAYSATSFATSLRKASDGIQTMRAGIDAEIAQAVSNLNTGLQQLESLNDQIVLRKHTGQDALSLLDQRDTVLLSLSEFIPLQTIQRDSGAVAVFSTSGRTLLDGSAAKFGFEQTAIIRPHMTFQNGLLSGLTIDGKPVDPLNNSRLDGGSLVALFKVRDDAAVNAQARVDAIALDTIERFGSGGADPTVGPGDAGLFTDDGQPFAIGDEVGIAGRIALNPYMTADQTDNWRWRSGINAASPGDAGASDLLFSFKAKINEALAPSASVLGAGANSLTRHIQTMTSDVASERVRLSDARNFSESQFQSIRESVAADGVNTDRELQKLIELESAFAANARVVRVVDDMLSELLRI